MPATAVCFDILDDVEPGDELEFRFRRDAIDDVVYLDAMVRNGYIEVRPMIHRLMMAIYESRSWDGDANRTFTVTVTERFDREFFEGRMWRALESLAPKFRCPLIDRNAVMAAREGQRIKLRFKEDGFAGLDELMELHHAGYIILHVAGDTILEAVILDEEWPPGRRVVEFEVTAGFERERDLVVDTFEEGILPHLEKLRIAP